MINTRKVKQRMKKLGLRQRDLAAVLHIAVPTVSQKINNIRPFTLNEAGMLAELLKLESYDLQEYFFQNDIA